VSEGRKGRRAAPPEEATGGSAGDASPGGAAPGPDAAAASVPVAAPAGPDAAGVVEDAAALKDRWLRAEAELQNFRRRAARDREESRRSAEEGVMLEIIAALDDLDRALAAPAEGGAQEAWAEGVRMVGRRFVEYLGRQGVVAEDPLGHAFDPAFHEAVLEVPVQGAVPGQVTGVLLKGWRRGARVLRAARVVLARAPEEGAG
jgi:molecular chaperone GrpE